MKKFIVLLAAAVFLSGCVKKTDTNLKSFNIVTSFYPIYAITSFITEGANNISLSNMAHQSSGCLHDYQLTTDNMKLILNSDAFIINGGGMEGFLDNVLSSQEDIINLIDTSIGIEGLDGHEHEGHSHGDENSHYWFSLKNSLIQAQNISSTLCKLNPENKDIYEKNLLDFTHKLSELENRLPINIDNSKKNIAVFHEAFIYLEEYGFNPIISISLDEEHAPSPSDFSNAIKKATENDVSVFITANEQSDLAAKAIIEETGGDIICLNPILSGEYEPNAFFDAIEKNISLLEAIKEIDANEHS